MASQVLSGSSNPSYTNNTGQNVRIVINYMARPSSGNIALNWAGVSASAAMQAIGRNIASSFIEVVDPPNSFVSREISLSSGVAGGGVAVALATYPGYGVATNNNGLAVTTTVSETYPAGSSTSAGSSTFGSAGNITGTKTTGSGALPTELMLAPGQTFSAICSAYNIVVIPEAG